jgi:lambda repressor-like predicted transcriptional regulator
MSVSAVSGGNSAWYAQTQTQTQPAQPDMANTAKLFDMSSSQLDQDLQSGTTLSSLASQDGVSSSSLISAIESDLQSNAPQGAGQLPTSQLQGMATNIANGTAPAGGHHGGHHHHGMEMTDTAQALGLSTSQLSSDLQSGTTLSSLASQDGVSSSSLISAIESDLQANAPQGAPGLSSDQLTQMATNIANGTPPSPPSSGGGQNQAGASQQASEQSITSVLAANAYANSAAELASSTGAAGQISQYI